MLQCHSRTVEANLRYHLQYQTARLRLASLLQERQRLETILNLCADYNHEDSAAELVRSVLLGGATGTCLDTGAGMSLQGVDKSQRVRENDEEMQREESSSTESTHQEVK